jgi:hypothetical protein
VFYRVVMVVRVVNDLRVIRFVSVVRVVGDVSVARAVNVVFRVLLAL